MIFNREKVEGMGGGGSNLIPCGFLKNASFKNGV